MSTVIEPPAKQIHRPVACRSLVDAYAHTPYLADPEDQVAPQAVWLARGGDQAIGACKTA